MQHRQKTIALAWVFLSTGIGPQVAWGISGQTIRSDRGMVTSAYPLASDVGLSILRKGGNAVDAAVATTLAVSVVEPFSAGIGGGGFLLLRQAATGDLKALDFREKAPLKATATMYLDAQGKVRPNASTDGFLSVGVPGTIAGLSEVQQRYGRLPWSTVVAPAVGLAERGFIVSNRLAQATRDRLPMLDRNPAARTIFTRNGQPFNPGDRLTQKDLGRTLRIIAKNPQDFYTGEIASAITRDMQRNGGLVTLEDLKTYKPTWRSPVCGSFKQMQVCSMPPPSSGGVHLIQLLNLWSGSKLESQPRHSPDALHFMAESMKIAYADRAIHLGDPGFVRVPVAALIDPAYAAQRSREISMGRARAAAEVKASSPEFLRRFSKKTESTETSHLSVVDPDRNAVSLTFTVNLNFGAGVVAAGTGILLNNEMDDFAIAPNTPNAFGLVGQQANAIAPGKIPLSSMTPTIVTEGGQFKLAVGSPGGSTIITTVFQILLNSLVYKMDAGQAVSAPRIHNQWLPDRLRVEKDGFDPSVLKALQAKGQVVEERSPWGNANLILVKPDNTLEGAADPRGEGSAVGY
ncbi:gamma-glutamyltransferase [Altericista sp. CCNU0014]|uniref:gamma-glutamyltransferase n=1 Tax=Altericista sp. CCNU0014 TaxID=3082949 RepID=UPI00384D5CDD